MQLNRKSGSLKLIVSLSLFLLIFIIAAKWGYSSLYKSSEVVPSGEIITLLPIGSDLAKNVVPDNNGGALKKVYAASIKTIDSKYVAIKSTAESAEVPKDKQLKEPDEINKLKAEINDLLKIKKNNDGFELAKQKIGELQEKINELAGRNDKVEKENKELYSMLKTISDERKAVNMNQTARPIPAVFENKVVAPEKPAFKKSEPVSVNYPGVANVVLEAADLQLSAITVLDNKELETYQALQTDKFVGSFTVRNNNSLNGIGAIVVVVQQPDGHVLQKSAWESGTFESPEGKKIYSCKLYFEYKAGEAKRISFALNADRSIKGNYIMQLYFKGKLIGKIYKTLL